MLFTSPFFSDISVGRKHIINGESSKNKGTPESNVPLYVCFHGRGLPFFLYINLKSSASRILNEGSIEYAADVLGQGCAVCQCFVRLVQDYDILVSLFPMDNFLVVVDGNSRRVILIVCQGQEAPLTTEPVDR